MATITANPSAGTLELDLNGTAQVYKPNPGVDLTDLYDTLRQMGEHFPANVIPYLRANAALQGAQDDPSSAALEPPETPGEAPPSGSNQRLPTFVPPEGEEPPPGVPGGPAEAVVAEFGATVMGTGPEQTIDDIPLAPDLPQNADWPEGGIQGDERPVYTGYDMGYMEDYETWRKSFPDGIVYSKADGGVEQALLDGRVLGAWDPATSSGTVFELDSSGLGFTPATASSPAVPGETEEEWQRELASHQPDQRSTKESNMKQYAVVDKASRKPIGQAFGTRTEAEQSWVFDHAFSEGLEIGIVIGDPATGEVQAISISSIDTAAPDVQLPASLAPTGESSFDDTTSRDDWQNSQDDNDRAANIAKTKVGDADVYTSMDDDGNPLSTYIDDGDGKGREIGKTESGPRRWTIARPPKSASRALTEAASKRERILVQYADSGNQLSTVRKTRPTLEAGIYQIKESMTGIYFEKVDINSDEVLRFEDERLDSIHEEIDRFWQLESAFREMGITHKRGVLLFGQPGMGKSVLLKQTMETAIAHDTVVFIGSRSMGTTVQGLREFKEVEPDRHTLVTMEDMDEICNYNEHAVLELMDGGDQMNGVLVLGTTNYPERLPPRILRSGRFDTKVEVKALPLAGRIAYFSHKLAKKESPERIREIAEATDGMSFAQMRELIASVYCYGRSFEASVKRIIRNLTEGRINNSWTEERLDRELVKGGVVDAKPARMLTESSRRGSVTEVQFDDSSTVWVDQRRQANKMIADVNSKFGLQATVKDTGHGFKVYLDSDGDTEQAKQVRDWLTELGFRLAGPYWMKSSKASASESTAQTQGPVTICGYEQWKSQIAAGNPGADFEQEGNTTTACVDGRVIGTYLADLDSGVLEAESVSESFSGKLDVSKVSSDMAKDQGYQDWLKDLQLHLGQYGDIIVQERSKGKAFAYLSRPGGGMSTEAVSAYYSGVGKVDARGSKMEAEVQPDPTAGTVDNPGSAAVPETPTDLKSADDEELQVAFFGRPVASILSDLSGEYSVDDILSLATRSDFETLEPVTRAMIMTAFDFFSTQTESTGSSSRPDRFSDGDEFYSYCMGEWPDGYTEHQGGGAWVAYDENDKVVGTYDESSGIALWENLEFESTGTKGSEDLSRGWQPYTDNKMFVRDLQAKFGADIQSQVVAPQLTQYQLAGARRIPVAWWDDMHARGAINTSIWTPSDAQMRESKISRDQLDRLWEKYDKLDRACAEEFGGQAPAARRAQVTRAFNEFAKACQYMGINPAREVRERTKAANAPTTIVKTEQRRKPRPKARRR